VRQVAAGSSPVPAQYTLNQVPGSAVDCQARSVSEHESSALGQGTDPLFSVAVKLVGAGGAATVADVGLDTG
jgi:hypothetical protein